MELPESDCSADSVRVVYLESNYGRDDAEIESFVEIRLHCTAPGGTAQVSGTRVLVTLVENSYYLPYIYMIVANYQHQHDS